MALPRSDPSRIVLETLDEGIIAFDADRNAIVANSRVSDLAGCSGNVEGFSAAILFENIPELLELVDRAFDEDYFVSDQDVVFRSEEAAFLHVSVSTSATRFRDNPGIVMILRDLSDVKHTEREIYQADKSYL